MAVEHIATTHYWRQIQLARRAARAVADLWGQVDAAAIAASWVELTPRALLIVAGAQGLAAAASGTYVGDVAAAYGLDGAPAGQVLAGAFAGVAADGRPLASLLRQPVVAALRTIGAGAPPARGLAAGRLALDMIVRTQVADAGRVADGVAITARRQLTGYVRLTSGKTCARCLILAGQRYRWNAGFQRHPRCFPAGVVVDGPRSEAATRRRYQGELVVLATASGQQLPLTGNHPVLTRRGWVPARLLQEGDEVVRRTRTEGASALVVPDHDQVPARIEDVWGSLGVPLLDAVESSPEDFHGDGQYGKVDVVWADRALDDRCLAAVAQHGRQLDLASATWPAVSLDGEGASELLDFGYTSHPRGTVGGGGLRFPLLGSLSSDASGPRFAHAAPSYSGLREDAGDRAARDAVLLREPVFTGAGEVCGHDGLGGQIEGLARWDAPGESFSMETRDGYATRGRDLLQRLTGQVEIDRLVEVRRVDWSGHVYSLTSVEGWHCANSLIVSNCDCRHIPVGEHVPGSVRTDPRAAFRAMSRAEQDQVFTQAGAQAIRDGADMNQVVNARRGMYTAGGRQLTRESTTRRGVARPGRPMPEALYAQARGDRDEAIRLLRLHGYLF